MATRDTSAVADESEGETLLFQRPLDAFIPAFSSPPLPFQMGVPANDAFPAKVWARLSIKAVRQDAMADSYADPRGELELRA